MNLAPTTVLAGRYELETRIAVGGMGEIWRARDTVLSRAVAVKVLKPEHAGDPTFLERFRREATHTASLSHPGIANVFDYGETDDAAFLVMEYVVGEPLSALLAREGRLTPVRAMDLVGQAGLALQAAHDAGVVHRDVKPGNLLLRPDGVVKVTDFGVARAVAASPVTQTGLVVGTAAYLSPEQAAGRPVTPASDVYSLGVVAYECLAGARPFDGDSAVTVALAHANTPAPPLPKDVPPLVADFVLSALAKEPSRRPASAGEFGRTALALAASMREAGAGGTKVMPAATTGSTATKTSEPPRDDQQRRRVRNLFVGIGVAVVVIGFFALRACSSATQVTMPRVVGESYTHAATGLRTLGLNAVAKHVADRHGRGYVLRQDPSPGSRLGAGSTVTLTVSDGPPRVNVDESVLLGQRLDQARTTLQSEHLRVAVVEVDAHGSPPGTVVGVNPTGTVTQGSTVTLSVAAGPHKHGKDEGGGGGD